MDNSRFATARGCNPNFSSLLSSLFYEFRTTEKIVLLAVSLLALCAGGSCNRQPEEQRMPDSTPESSKHESTHPRRQFRGYDCTEDCSGHEAGYEWAEQHDITDGDDCDTAGSNSNSASFAKGCHAFVDGESDDDAKRR